MEATKYTLSLLTREGLRMGIFDEQVPLGKNRSNLPVGEQTAIVSKLMNRGLDRMFVKYGPCHCHICGKEANLYMNNFIFCKSQIFDTVSALCDHGVCEIQAVRIRKETMQKLATEILLPPGAPSSAVKESHPCVVCGKENFRTCAGCKLTAYCGRDCQKKDWPQHKAVCKARSHAT